MKFLPILLLLATTQVFAKWSVTTFNIRNFDHDPEAGPTNITELTRIIGDVKSEVMGFQEVVNYPAFEKVIKRALPGYTILRSSCGGFGKQNLALAFDTSKFELVKMEEDLSYSGNNTNACGSLRPVLLITLRQKLDGKNYIFGIIHLKAGGDERAMKTRWNQYKKLALLAGQNEKANLILLGDFNTTGYNIKNDDYAKFEELLSTTSMRTMTETLACTNFWHGADEASSYLPSTLDHIVMPERLAAQVQNTRVGSHCARSQCRASEADDLGLSFQSVSDHCPVQVTFK